MATNDGGPAFPQVLGFGDPQGGGWRQVDSIPGMSLRDYFAGQALVGLLATPEVLRQMRDEKSDRVLSTQETYARVAYDYAAAMLAERERSR